MPEVPSADWLSYVAELFGRWWVFWTKDVESIRTFFAIAGGGVGLGLLWWRTKNIHRQTGAALDQAAIALEQAETARQQAVTARDRHEAQVEADRERRITDSFTKAVEQLGSEKLAPQLGAIYALERIARESRHDHWAIMETLTAFVRERSPWPPVAPSRMIDENGEKEPQPATEVQAILTVIGRRRREHEDEDQALDLCGTDLRGYDLSNAHLERSLLIHAHLEGSSLISAHLQEARFWEAHLKGADFFDAHLEGAGLNPSDLTQEQFDSAHSDEYTQVPRHIKRPVRYGGPIVEAAAE
jgi:Pentapeptide repeats (8 copies)